MKDYIEALREIKKEKGVFEITLSRKEVLELINKIDRLNNIINELEKWLEEQHQFIIEIPAYTKEISIEHKTMEICYENVLEKLQGLKGDSSNE